MDEVCHSQPASSFDRHQITKFDDGQISADTLQTKKLSQSSSDGDESEKPPPVRSGLSLDGESYIPQPKALMKSCVGPSS